MAAPAPEELEAGGARVRARYPRKDDFKAAELRSVAASDSMGSQGTRSRIISHLGTWDNLGGSFIHAIEAEL